MTDLETQVAEALERLRLETWIEGPPGQTLIEWLAREIAPRVAAAIRAPIERHAGTVISEMNDVWPGFYEAEQENALTALRGAVPGAPPP